MGDKDTFQEVPLMARLVGDVGGLSSVSFSSEVAGTLSS